MNAHVSAPDPRARRRGRALRLALCAATLAAAGLGSAVAADAPPAIHVPYGDLNLTSEAGMQALLHRLSAAAHQLCDDSASRELRRMVRAERCYHDTLDGAVVSVHNERLSALYRARVTGGTT